MMENERSPYSYNRGIALMVIVVLPISLIVASVIIWFVSETSSNVGLVLANNAAPLFAFSVLPASAVSVLHTKLLRALHVMSPIKLRAKSIAAGAIFGGLLSVGLSLLLFASVHVKLWPLLMWGVGMGGMYGLTRALIGTMRVSERQSL